MSLLQRAREDKAAALALDLVARECLSGLGVEPGSNLVATCAANGVSRPLVYAAKARIEEGLAAVATPGPGRPRQGATAGVAADLGSRSLVEWELLVAVLEYRLEHPGAVVIHASGRATYNAGFKRFILNASDRFVGRDEDFCRVVKVPWSTFMTWRQLDAKEPIISPQRPERRGVWPTGAQPNELARTVIDDYMRWEGKFGDFLRDASRRLGIAPVAVRGVLRIACMLAPNNIKPPRYRGATIKGTPGAIIVTDGKDIKVNLTASGESRTFNWQGTVDQATACHLAVVVTPTEDAAAAGDAYMQAWEFLGRPPLALVHDQKPIYWDTELRKLVELETVMIPATLERPENKAVVEGQFGLFEQQVGTIVLDDTNTATLVMSAAREVLRAFTAASNHAARAELNGRSRAEAVRAACPDPKKDAALVASLKANHLRGRHRAAPLPTAPVALALLDEAYANLGLTADDAKGSRRPWLAATYEPAAIRQAVAIFGAMRAKGKLRGKYAERYLIKLIRESQVEIDLEREGDLLLKWAETERSSWLAELIKVADAMRADTESPEEFVMELAEQALYGGIFLEKAFWEKALIEALSEAPTLLGAVMTHTRRLYEASPDCRRQLMNRLVTWHAQLARPIQ